MPMPHRVTPGKQAVHPSPLAKPAGELRKAVLKEQRPGILVPQILTGLNHIAQVRI
jgi:hypothetical protein